VRTARHGNPRRRQAREVPVRPATGHLRIGVVTNLRAGEAVIADVAFDPEGEAAGSAIRHRQVNHSEQVDTLVGVFALDFVEVVPADLTAHISDKAGKPVVEFCCGYFLGAGGACTKYSHRRRGDEAEQSSHVTPTPRIR
jgi:hypothetical protein